MHPHMQCTHDDSSRWPAAPDLPQSMSFSGLLNKVNTISMTTPHETGHRDSHKLKLSNLNHRQQYIRTRFSRIGCTRHSVWGCHASRTHATKISEKR
jgi:hypothetical protein